MRTATFAVSLFRTRFSFPGVSYAGCPDFDRQVDADDACIVVDGRPEEIVQLLVYELPDGVSIKPQWEDPQWPTDHRHVLELIGATDG